MPGPGIEEAIGFAIVSAANAILDTSVVVSATTATIIGGVTLSAGLAGLSFLLAPKPPGAPSGTSGHLTLKQPISPRVWAYGDQVRLGGTYVLYEVNSTGGSVDVLAVCQGPIQGFISYYLNDDRVGIDSVTGSVNDILDASGTSVPNGNANNDGRYNLDGGFGFGPGELVFIKTRLGAFPETAYSDVETDFSFWTSASRGDGVASLELRCAGTSATSFQRFYPNGKPEPSALIVPPAIWDFRDPGQSATSPATWIAYSAYDPSHTYAAGDRVLSGAVVYLSLQSSNTGNTPGSDARYWVSVFGNPILQLVDFLCDPDHGMALDRDTLITPSIADLSVQANICDVAVQKADSTWETRYRSNGFLTFDADPANTLAAMLATFDGWMIVDGEGALSVKAGQYEAPTTTFTEAHIYGASVQYGMSQKDVVNELVISFTDPANHYKTEPGDPWRNEDDISSRGKVLSQNLDLPWVQSHPQARRLAKRAMARLAAPIRGTLVTNLFGISALGQRFVGVQWPQIAGLEDVVVEIQRVETNLLGGTVTFDWVLVDPSTIDAWNPSTEEGIPPPIVTTSSGDTLTVPTSVSGFFTGDATSGFFITVRFLDPDRSDIGYAVRYRPIIDGTPGVWAQTAFATPTVDGSFMEVSFPAPGSGLFEVQLAFVGPRGAYTPWSASLFLAPFSLIETTAALGSISLTSGSAKTLGSFELPAGAFDIQLAVYFDPGLTTSITRLQSSISLVDNTLDPTMGRWSDLGMPASVPGNNANLTQLTPKYRVFLSAPTTFYAVAQGDFTVSTLTASCYMRAAPVV